MEDHSLNKPRILCLHGHTRSGEFLKRLVLQWPESVIQKLDLVFLNGPFPMLEPDSFEWFQANEDFTEYSNFEECLAYIEDYMVKNGPFDGFLGHSQGVTLGKVDKIKFVILSSAAKLGGEKFAAPELASNAFSKPIECPSLHFIGGETDKAMPESIALLKEFVEPVVIYHTQGHTVPRLDDDKSLGIMLGLIDTIQGTLTMTMDTAWAVKDCARPANLCFWSS
uniref:Serine hydrolase domain-containing protein n=1 Tax=Lotus japonicus TaxID=34305 RepID=I3SQX9_LOTJA|nr:unknown [Lotus japonicus]